MIDSVTSLRLRPLTTYSDNDTVKTTTITSFEDMLEDQKVAGQQQVTAEEAGLDSSVTDNTSGVVYRDPSTGANVRYVDVAASDDGAEQSTQASSGTSSTSSTTSASSMKKTKYDAYFKEAALKYSVSESLLKAVAKAESDFNANCVSSAGAIGVMQLMPATAKGLGVTDPYDPKQNIMGGAKYIAQKLKEYNGDVELALAAYNGGSGAVKKYGGVPPYCKTYVKRVLSYKEAYETAAAVG